MAFNIAYTFAVVIVIYYALKFLFKFYVSSDPYRHREYKTIVIRGVIGFIICIILGSIFGAISNHYAPVKLPDLNLILP